VFGKNCNESELHTRTNYNQINSGESLLPSFQKLLSSHFLCKSLKIKIHKIKFSLVALYGCETWSLALREEHRFRVFENRSLRGLFRPKSEEVAGDWKRLHNEELHELYNS
jgi:hypothetical protein